MNHALYLEAVRLRELGWSYSLIAKKLDVAKSTLSIWLRKIPYTPNEVVRKRVNAALLKTVMSRHAAKLETLREAELFAERTFSTLSQRDLLMIGLGLFIGEGSKRDETVHIINSDPAVLRLAVTWLRKSFRVPLANFRVILHLYPDNSEEESKAFWSRSLNIPPTQFEKTQIDRRTNKSPLNHRKLPYGTAHIKVRACGKAEFGVILHRRIMALALKAYNHTRV